MTWPGVPFITSTTSQKHLREPRRISRKYRCKWFRWTDQWRFQHFDGIKTAIPQIREPAWWCRSSIYTESAELECTYSCGLMLCVDDVGLADVIRSNCSRIKSIQCSPVHRRGNACLNLILTDKDDKAMKQQCNHCSVTRKNAFIFKGTQHFQLLHCVKTTANHCHISIHCSQKKNVSKRILNFLGGMKEFSTSREGKCQKVFVNK